MTERAVSAWLDIKLSPIGSNVMAMYYCYYTFAGFAGSIVCFACQDQHTHFLAERVSLKHALVHHGLLSWALRDQLVALGLVLALLLETLKEQPL